MNVPVDFLLYISLTPDSCIGLVVKASTLKAADLGFNSFWHCRDFSGSRHIVTYKLLFQWLSCQVLGIIGSVLEIVGPVSVYCDWVR